MCTFTCGQLGLGPPAGTAGSPGGGGEGGAGAAGPRDGERDGGHWGGVQLRGRQRKMYRFICARIFYYLFILQLIIILYFNFNVFNYIL